MTDPFADIAQSLLRKLLKENFIEVYIDDDFLSASKAIATALRAAHSQGMAEGIADEWKEIRRWKPFLHWCQDWDGLLINKGEPEFDSCGCFDKALLLTADGMKDKEK